MQIFVNDKPVEVVEGATLKDWLLLAGYAQKQGIAVAVNDRIITRTAWGQQTLKSFDRITLIGAFYGG